MTAVDEIIEEGEAREVALVPVEQHVERLDETATPEAMVGLAARMASALSDIVEKRGLFATIQGKKYPTVEAWMTIGRMDNVAAREIPGGIHRIEEGGWEAEVELIRLSDGMRVGYGSALCGTAGDNPWASRPVHVQRSMAVTRATSRAFRQRYSWIMALAGYEPTPADEMPHEPERSAPRRAVHDSFDAEPERKPLEQRYSWERKPLEQRYSWERKPLEQRAEGMTGKVSKGSPPVDLEYRTEIEPGPTFGFKLTVDRKGYQCIAIGPLAEALSVAGLKEGDEAQVWGIVEKVPWEKDGKSMPPYSRVHLERVATDEWVVPTSKYVSEAAEAEFDELVW